ncbi:RINT-1 family protein-like protein [Calycina marina]|uniref:RINT-1 family protein-like protein n=1 Tax=Calycina marina TaxID=1763456 RepID=A0A9P7Z241_9HELO|nr:RINT-1 family protein-like protein [Calycina marina]
MDVDETNTRLNDYLTDKFQKPADFNDIDSLLETVSLQRQQLDNQLKDARTKLVKSNQASKDNAARIRKDAHEFERQQSDVQRRIMVITSSDNVDEATRSLNGPMEKLRKVDLAKGYIELLKEVNDLVADTRSHLPGNPKEALKPYEQLKRLTMALHNKQENAEGAGVHLVSHVDQTTTRLWAEMKKIMTDEFQIELSMSKWPKEKSTPTAAWGDCFEKLLELQYHELLSSSEPLVLLPVAEMAKTFIQNFEYQFMSEKPTSQPQHLGDYYLEWFLGLLLKLEDYLRDGVSIILAGFFQGSPLAANTVYIDPVSAFITSFLPILKEKTNSVIQAIINKDPTLLSRFIAQLLKFDDSLRTQYNYDAGDSDLGWGGIAGDVLSVNFDRWLEVEKRFAFDQYAEIIRSPNAGLIDRDSAGYGKTKWSFGADQVVDILLATTNSYRRLRSFDHKFKFLSEIQAEIIDRFQGRLAESLDAYRTITSRVARTIHGITKEDQAKIQGIGGLDILCRVYGSANHVINNLTEWGNQDFFLDMYLELKARVKKGSISNDANLAGSMSYNEVKEAMSESLGTEDGLGSVFDALTSSYKERLLEPSADLLVQAFRNSFPILFRPYVDKAQWTTVGDVDESAIAISAELDYPLKALRQQLNFLVGILSYSAFRRVWRPAYDALEQHLWNEVLMRQNFTALGAARFLHDVYAIQDATDSACAVYRQARTADLDMEKLVHGVRLLNLPLTDDAGGPSLSDGSDVRIKLGHGLISKDEARRIIVARMETDDQI